MLKKLGRYPVLDEIGQGGFSTVYRGLDPMLDREVALKVMHPLLLSDPNFNQRFRREARALAALRHPQIIVIYEVAEAEGRLFIVMELANGPSLAKHIADEGPVPWKEVLGIVKPVCQALDYAHRQGIIHRDLKPSNILLDAERGALLSDFGLARVLIASTGTSVSTSIGNSGGILGTPSYIAPELWEYESAHPQSDIYSLGCIIYEMLTGNLLFDGKTPVQILRAHDRGPQFPEDWPQGVPSGVEDVLRRALAREPEDRHASALELYEALEDLEHDSRTERERSHRNSAVEQWRKEALSAIQAGEWGAARMLVGRWLAVTPGDADALAARAEIDRRRLEALVAQQAAAEELPVAQQEVAAAEELPVAQQEVAKELPVAQQEVAAVELPVAERPQVEPLLVSDTAGVLPAVENEVAAHPPVAQPPVGQRSLNIYEVGILFAALFAGIGLVNLSATYEWLGSASWMLLIGALTLVLLAMVQLNIPRLAPYRVAIHTTFMALSAVGLVFAFLLFYPDYDETDYRATLNVITLFQGVLFLLLLVNRPNVQVRSAGVGPAATAAGVRETTRQKPLRFQIETRTTWIIMMVLIVLVTWLSLNEWYWYLPPSAPMLLILIPILLLALYLNPAILIRFRPIFRRIFMTYVLVNAIAWPLILFQEFRDDYRFLGFLIGRLAELVLFALLLKGNMDDRKPAAAGDISAPRR